MFLWKTALYDFIIICSVKWEKRSVDNRQRCRLRKKTEEDNAFDLTPCLRSLVKHSLIRLMEEAIIKVALASGVEASKPLVPQEEVTTCDFLSLTPLVRMFLNNCLFKMLYIFSSPLHIKQAVHDQERRIWKFIKFHNVYRIHIYLCIKNNPFNYPLSQVVGTVLSAVICTRPATHPLPT